MAGVRGDFSKLRDLQRKVEALSRAQLLPQLAERIGAAFMRQVADEFRQSRDPYGRPWAAVHRRRARDIRARRRRAARGLAPRADKPLVDTGRLRASAVSRVSGASVRIILPVEYASFHQQGTSRIRRRQILPEPSTGGLGPLWTKAANREASRLLREHFGKR